MKFLDVLNNPDRLLAKHPELNEAEQRKLWLCSLRVGSRSESA